MRYVETLNDLGGYRGLAARIEAGNSGEDDVGAAMATFACEVRHSDGYFDWTDFCRVAAPGFLKIGPYQDGNGSPVIPFERCACSACARTGEVQRVPDVDAYSGHVACASSTRSELALLLRNGAGELIAVFDIDSDQFDALTAHDGEAVADILATVFGRSPGVPAS